MTYRTPEDHARETGTTLRFLRGMIRRMAVTLTDGVLWQLLGQRGGQGGDETVTVEPFSGIGFYSRPSTSSTANPEAITAAVGGHKNTVIVATRDEGTRKIGAGDLNANETCVFNDVERVILKANGTVEIRLHGGAALVEPTIKGTTYRAAEDTMFTALTTCLVAINAYAVAIKAIADPTNVATLALTAALAACEAAIAAFQAAAATYLTTVLKAQ